MPRMLVTDDAGFIGSHGMGLGLGPSSCPTLSLEEVFREKEQVV